jgi:hypothetical protein
MAKKKQILFLLAARPRFSSKIIKDHQGSGYFPQFGYYGSA